MFTSSHIENRKWNFGENLIHQKKKFRTYYPFSSNILLAIFQSTSLISLQVRIFLLLFLQYLIWFNMENRCKSKPKQKNNYSRFSYFLSYFQSPLKPCLFRLNFSSSPGSITELNAQSWMNMASFLFLQTIQMLLTLLILLSSAGVVHDVGLYF